MRRKSIVERNPGDRVPARFMAGAVVPILALTCFSLSFMSVPQGNGSGLVTSTLRNLAAKAQQYYRSQGNSSFVGFALDVSDTGDLNGSYSIQKGGMPPSGSAYVAGSMTPADSSSAQTLYIIGCGKTPGNDGTSPTKVYVVVTSGGVRSFNLN